MTPRAFGIQKTICGHFCISGYPDGSDRVCARCAVGDDTFGVAANGRGWIAGPNRVVLPGAVARRELARHDGLSNVFRHRSAATGDGGFLGLPGIGHRTARTLTLRRCGEGRRHVVPSPGGGSVSRIVPQGDGTALVRWYDGHGLVDGALLRLP